MRLPIFDVSSARAKPVRPGPFPERIIIMNPNQLGSHDEAAGRQVKPSFVQATALVGNMKSISPSRSARPRRRVLQFSRRACTKPGSFFSRSEEHTSELQSRGLISYA